MVKTKSIMLELGTEAPDFELTDVVGGEIYRLSNFSDKKGLLVMSICRHCPYVQNVEEEIAKLAKDYEDEDLAIVAISANDKEAYPEDAPANLKKQAEELGFNFPYLYDEDQSTARDYTFTCTPEFFLFDEDRKLFYRGQMDDSRPGNDISSTGEDLREAIDRLLEGKEPPEEQTPSQGCSIKWKEGNEPDYL